MNLRCHCHGYRRREEGREGSDWHSNGIRGWKRVDELTGPILIVSTCDRFTPLRRESLNWEGG